MKRFTSILIALVMIGTSQASTNQHGTVLSANPIVTETQHKTAIRNVPVRVKIQKPKLFVGNPHKVTIFADDYDDEFLEFDDLITSYRRRDLNKIEHEDGISDKIRWRLFLARQLAMLKYKEVHG